MSMLVGIISYMPNDLDRRKERLRVHQEQLAWIHRVLDDPQILIVAQNYEISEIEDSYNLCVHADIKVFDKGIGPARARDVILKEFYNSDYDHLLIMDDDSMIYPYYGCEDIFREVSENPDKFSKIDAFCSQHPRYLPFKERVYQDKLNLSKWKFTRRPPNTGAQIAILRNIKKFKDKEVYHQAGVMDALKEGETDFTQVASEDVAFHLDWVRAGLNYFTLEVMQLKESPALSTIFSEDVSERISQEKILINNFVKLNSGIGLEIKKGRVNWSKVFGYFNNTASEYYVDRKYPLECFPLDMIPKKLKEQEQTKRKLF